MNDEFLVLHALRLKGMASPEALVEGWGVAGAADELGRLTAQGCCMFRELPRAKGYLLMPPGRERHAALLAEMRAAAGDEALAALAGVYDRFSPINDEFKELCSRWQMKGSAMNDHTDAEYDHERISELEELHGRFLPLAMRAARAVPHFQPYTTRFRSALKRLVDDGDHDYFTKPLVDSYHTVWFEFHEDLILTLGRERQAHET